MKMTESLAHGYLSESTPMNTNMTGFRCFKNSLRPRALDESSVATFFYKQMPGNLKGVKKPGISNHYLKKYWIYHSPSLSY